MSRNQTRKLKKTEKNRDAKSDIEIKNDAKSLKESIKQRMRKSGGGLRSAGKARPRQMEELFGLIAWERGLCIWICVPEWHLMLIFSKEFGWGVSDFNAMSLSASESYFRHGLRSLVIVHSWREVFLFFYFQVQRESE